MNNLLKNKPHRNIGKYAKSVYKNISILRETQSIETSFNLCFALANYEILLGRRIEKLCAYVVN
jgi:hypothetical protein